MEVWITKYALTQGIFKKDVEDCGDGMVMDKSSTLPVFYHGSDWHRDWESAVAKANAMRDRKIQSLKKKIAELEGMKFV